MDMKLSAAKRLFYVTSRYPQLQGAGSFPCRWCSLARRGGAPANPTAGDHLPRGPEAWFFAGLGTAIVASYVIRRWYSPWAQSASTRRAVQHSLSSRRVSLWDSPCGFKSH